MTSLGRRMVWSFSAKSAHGSSLVDEGLSSGNEPEAPALVGSPGRWRIVAYALWMLCVLYVRLGAPRTVVATAFLAAIILGAAPTFAADNFAINNAVGSFTIIKSTDDGTGAQEINVVLAAGGALIGHVITDAGSLTNINPTTSSTAAIPPISSAAAESSHVICAAACNLWTAAVTTGAVAGFFLVANATSAQADGAIVPIECVQVPANSTASINFGAGPPDRYSAGVTLLFSTTGCFNLTKSATAFFKGRGV